MKGGWKTVAKMIRRIFRLRGEAEENHQLASHLIFSNPFSTVFMVFGVFGFLLHLNLTAIILQAFGVVLEVFSDAFFSNGCMTVP